MSARTQSSKVVVSITPLPLNRDSRTFKQASSVARLGYRSILVEGEPSGFAQAGLSFELISLGGLSSAERARGERVNELRRWNVALQRQRSVGRTTVSGHLRFTRHLKEEIAEVLPEFTDSSDLDELTASLKDFEGRARQLESRFREHGSKHARRDNFADAQSLSIDDIAQLTASHAKSLTRLYRELDELAQLRINLIGHLRERQHAAKIRSAERLACGATIMGIPPGRRLVKAAYRASRVATHLLLRLWSRAVLEHGRLGDSRRARVANWRNSETRMFLRHLRAYTMVHVWRPLRCTPKASLYYLHSFYQFPAIYLLCLLYRAKFIYDAHDFYSHMDDHAALSPYWREWVLPFEGMIERACMRRAAAVVTVNQGVADLIQQRFGRTAVILRNAHDPRLEKPVEVTVRQAANLHEGAFVIVCVGQFKGGRAVAEAVQAVASLPSRYHLAFVGSGYPSFRELLDSQGLANRVHFLPAVEPARVVPFIRTADAGIVLYYPLSPTHSNSLPNGFFQVIAAGLPVMYPELPEIRRVVEQYALGVPIDPQDPASIAAGAIRLGEDQALMRQLRTNVEKSRGNLSWEQDEQQLRNLLERVAGPPLAQTIGHHAAQQHA